MKFLHDHKGINYVFIKLFIFDPLSCGALDSLKEFLVINVSCTKWREI